MWDSVVKSVRPGRIGHRHGAVVDEPVAVKHPEHGVATHSQKGGPHAFGRAKLVVEYFKNL